MWDPWEGDRILCTFWSLSVLSMTTVALPLSAMRIWTYLSRGRLVRAAHSWLVKLVLASVCFLMAWLIPRQTLLTADFMRRHRSSSVAWIISSVGAHLGTVANCSPRERTFVSGGVRI